MVRGLLVLTSVWVGSRDLWWPLDPEATRGYNVYRAHDAPYNWRRLNRTGPVPGNFYRDQSAVELVEYAVRPQDFVDAGATGMRVFKLPETPYSTVVRGRPQVASSPDDIEVVATYDDGTTATVRAGEVTGLDQLVYLRTDRELPTGGAVSSYPLIDFDENPSFAVRFKRLVNFVDIAADRLRTYYTVVPVGPGGELHGAGAPGSEIVNSMQVDRMDYMQREMVRRNAWIFEQVGEPAQLMFRRRAGEPCGCVDPGSNIPRTGCPSCYETGVVGGYYGPCDFLFIDPDQAALRTLDEGGVKVERSSRSYLGPCPIVQDGDLILRRNGERLAISGVVYKMPRGVLLQQDFQVELLQTKDTRYLIPVNQLPVPVLYNPAVSPDPLNWTGGAEPVYTASSIPGSLVENPNLGAGRTITFGRIEG